LDGSNYPRTVSYAPESYNLSLPKSGDEIMASDVSQYVDQYDERQSYQKLRAKPGSIRGFETPDGWIIGRALVTELVIYDPYEFSTQFAAGGSSNSGQGNIAVQDASSREIIYHEKVGELWECFQGYNFGQIRVYQEVNGSHFGTIQKDIGSWVVSATAGSVFGFVLEGWESLYKQETGRGRFLLPPYQYMRWFLYNPSGQAKNITSRYIFNKMQFSPFDPEDPEQFKFMVDILRGKIRRDVWLYTPGIELYPFKGKTLQEIYGVKPLKWDGFKAEVNGGSVQAGGD
jgi:hypothetical protein